VASYEDGTIGKYNATTGAVINATFISGLRADVAGIAMVVTPESSAAAFQDKVVASGANVLSLLEWLLTDNNYFYVVGFCVTVLLIVWALLMAFRKKEAVLPFDDVLIQQESNPEVDAPPRTSLIKALKNPLFIGAVALLLVGVYAVYSLAMSFYESKLNDLKIAARQQIEAEQKQIQPQVQQPVAPTQLTLPAVLVDSDNVQTENNWLAYLIGKRIAGFAYLALHPNETTFPDIRIQAKVKAVEHQVHLEISGFSKDSVAVDLHPDFAWDPSRYAPLASQLLGNPPPDPGKPADPLPDELTMLLQLTGPNLAREDVILSGLLQKYPAWSAIHEQAALLMVAFALRDRAEEYTDYRPALCRATAHLALADALRGSSLPTWAGEIADAGIRALSGREVDALKHLDDLLARSDCPEAAKTWIMALRLRAKNDWRLVMPDAGSPLLLKIAWFQSLNDNLPSLPALRQLEKTGKLDDISDWGHASLDNHLRRSVETDNQFCQATTAQEIHELAAELALENAAPAPTQSIGTVLSEPLKDDLYVGQPPALRVVGPNMFKDFVRRHLLMELNTTYFWLRDDLGVPDETEKFRSATSDSFAGMRYLESLGFFDQGDFTNIVILKELSKKGVKLGPWELANGLLPGNGHNPPIHPDMDTLNTFYQDGLPFGTAYDLAHRPQSLYTGSSFHKQLPLSDYNYHSPTYPYPNDLHALAPDSYDVFSLYINKQTIFEASKPWWNYNLRSIEDVEKTSNSLDDEDYTMILQKHAALEPDVYFQLGKHLRDEGKDDQAAEADRKGFDQALDQVAMSNKVGPLVDYYYDHDHKDEAEMVAKRAAEVYSCQGLQTYCQLLEKLGRFSEAEQNAQAIADRYNDRSVLDALYAAHKDIFADRNKILLDKVFPHGLEKVSMSSFKDAPMAGCVFTSNSDLLQQASLQSEDIVVAFDGYRVENEDQYEYIRALSTDPKMDLIIWRSDRYFEVHASAPNRKFQVDIDTYSAPVH